MNDRDIVLLLSIIEDHPYLEFAQLDEARVPSKMVAKIVSMYGFGHDGVSAMYLLFEIARDLGIDTNDAEFCARNHVGIGREYLAKQILNEIGAGV